MGTEYSPRGKEKNIRVIVVKVKLTNLLGEEV
jgi:hypothetical protein